MQDVHLFIASPLPCTNSIPPVPSLFPVDVVVVRFVGVSTLKPSRKLIQIGSITLLILTPSIWQLTQTQYSITSFHNLENKLVVASLVRDHEKSSNQHVIPLRMSVHCCRSLWPSNQSWIDNIARRETGTGSKVSTTPTMWRHSCQSTSRRSEKFTTRNALFQGSLPLPPCDQLDMYVLLDLQKSPKIRKQRPREAARVDRGCIGWGKPGRGVMIPNFLEPIPGWFQGLKEPDLEPTPRWNRLHHWNQFHSSNMMHKRRAILVSLGL